jgi:hypothetical protein
MVTQREAAPRRRKRMDKRKKVILSRDVFV